MLFSPDDFKYLSQKIKAVGYKGTTVYMVLDGFFCIPLNCRMQVMPEKKARMSICEKASFPTNSRAWDLREITESY